MRRDSGNPRRTLYGRIDRQDLPNLFRAFDFAVPDQSVGRRPQTTTPQQALFGLNAPLVIEQARSLAGRAEVATATSPEDRVAALYRLVLAREPEPEEIETALRFLDAAAEEQQAICWVLLWRGTIVLLPMLLILWRVVRMKHAIDAIYEDGTFRPIQRDAIALADGQRVRIIVDDECESEALRLAMSVYDGLSDNDIDEIEQIAFERGSFFGTRSPD